MNVAVCFSGQIRSLDQTYESIENLLKNSFKKFRFLPIFQKMIPLLFLMNTFLMQKRYMKKIKCIFLQSSKKTNLKV